MTIHNDHTYRCIKLIYFDTIKVILCDILLFFAKLISVKGVLVKGS
jgi:hypothetical protein